MKYNLKPTIMIKKIKAFFKQRWDRRREKMPVLYIDFLKQTLKKLKGYMKMRRVQGELYNILRGIGTPQFSLSYGWHFMFIWSSALRGRDPIILCKDIHSAMTNGGWSQRGKWTLDDSTLDGEYRDSKGENTIHFHVQMTDSCEIEQYTEEVTKQRVVGLCAKALEELKQ